LVKFHNLFFQSNDIILSLILIVFIAYDLTNLFTLTHPCILLMEKWLLMVHSIILLMKIMLSIIDNLDEETNCSINTTKVIAFIFYIILYPFLIVWNIFGTMWFINIEEEPGECVNNYILIYLIDRKTALMINRGLFFYG
jgi:hypothetical protein